ncbi:MAG: putative signal transducing protein [Anaerolineae bacterium]
MNREEKKQDLVTIATTQGLLRANVIRGVLESAGIPVMLKYEAIGPIVGLTVDGLGRVEIRVPREWEAEAHDLLEAKPKSGEVFSVPPDLQETDEA